MPEIYFKVQFIQNCEYKEINFPCISLVREFLIPFIVNQDSICWIKDVQITRRYVSFSHDPEVLDLETVLFHWGFNNDSKT